MKEKSKDKDDDILYLYQGVVPTDIKKYHEILRCSYCFRKTIGLKLLKSIIVVFLLLLIFLQDLWISLIFSIIVLLPIFYPYVVMSDKAIETLLSKLNKINFNLNFDDFLLKFYEDRFVMVHGKENNVFLYKNIINVYESDTYLIINTREKAFYILKETCNDEMLLYIRNLTRKYRRCKKENNKKYKKVSFFLFVVFILTLLTPIIGYILVMNRNLKIDGIYHFGFVQSTWIFLLFIPFSLFSYFIGIVYKNRGYKSNKNIIAGGILTLLFFMIWYPPFYIDDYIDGISEYKNIINFDVPDKGKVQYTIDFTENDLNKINYNTVHFIYENIDTTMINKDISKNKNWKRIEDFDLEKKMLLPSYLKKDNESYFQIYNETTDEYNVVPLEKGIYAIHIMRYNSKYKKLEIHNFVYCV